MLHVNDQKASRRALGDPDFAARFASAYKKMYPDDLALDHEFGMHDVAHLHKAMVTAPPAPEAPILGADLGAMPVPDVSKLALIRRWSAASMPGLHAMREACKLAATTTREDTGNLSLVQYPIDCAQPEGDLDVQWVRWLDHDRDWGHTVPYTAATKAFKYVLVQGIRELHPLRPFAGREVIIPNIGIDMAKPTDLRMPVPDWMPRFFEMWHRLLINNSPNPRRLDDCALCGIVQATTGGILETGPIKCMICDIAMHDACGRSAAAVLEHDHCPAAWAAVAAVSSSSRIDGAPAPRWFHDLWLDDAGGNPTCELCKGALVKATQALRGPVGD